MPIAGDRLTIGRFPEANDLALEPDPQHLVSQHLVSRHQHCVIERETAGWWVVDHGSLNGTFVRRGQEVLRVRSRLPLDDGNAILVLARTGNAGESHFWEMAFHDPLKTQSAVAVPGPACLRYDPMQARLFLVEHGRERPIELRPQEHRLVQYMAERNQSGGGIPVLCTHDELLQAVWGDDPQYTPGELTHLVWELRRELGDQEAEAPLLETERGLGWRLRTCR